MLADVDRAIGKHGGLHLGHLEGRLDVRTTQRRASPCCRREGRTIERFLKASLTSPLKKSDFRSSGATAGLPSSAFRDFRPYTAGQASSGTLCQWGVAPVDARVCRVGDANRRPVVRDTRVGARQKHEDQAPASRCCSRHRQRVPVNWRLPCSRTGLIRLAGVIGIASVQSDDLGVIAHNRLPHICRNSPQFHVVQLQAFHVAAVKPEGG
jgi:hypothetical protein